MAKITLASVAVITALLMGGCSSLTKEYDETAGWSAQKIYSEAKDSLDTGAYDRAIKLYERLEARYPYGPYAQQAQIEIAYTYYRNGDAASALAACDRFIRLHPNHPNVDYVYYLKGLVDFNEDLGLLGALANQDLSDRDPKGAKESFDTFRTLVTRFPDSKYAPDARQRMLYLVNSMALHEVHVASYYYKRGAYVAAVNRAQSALRDFPHAPATEEALFIMVKSYDAMGLDTLRDDSDRVMHQNFPNSEYFKRGLASNAPWWKLW